MPRRVETERLCLRPWTLDDLPRIVPQGRGRAIEREGHGAIREQLEALIGDLRLVALLPPEGDQASPLLAARAPVVHADVRNGVKTVQTAWEKFKLVEGYLAELPADHPAVHASGKTSEPVNAGVFTQESALASAQVASAKE